MRHFEKVEPYDFLYYHGLQSRFLKQLIWRALYGEVHIFTPFASPLIFGLTDLDYYAREIRVPPRRRARSFKILRGMSRISTS